MRQAIFVLMMALAGSLNGQAQAISLTIETETGQIQFRAGEAIGLKLALENSSGHWMITITGRDRSVPGLGTDRFVVSPDAGTSDPWSYRLGEGLAYSGPGGMSLGKRPRLRLWI